MNERTQIGLVIGIVAALVIGLMLIPPVIEEVPMEDKLFEFTVSVWIPDEYVLFGSIDLVASQDGIVVDHPSLSDTVQAETGIQRLYISENTWMWNETLLISFSIGIGGFGRQVDFPITIDDEVHMVDVLDDVSGIRVRITSREVVV